MSPAGPLPEPPKRRTWLWVLLGIIGACILLCCGTIVWTGTAGRGWVCDEIFPTLMAQPMDAEERAQMRDLYRQACQGN
jgi:hypothetical protein